jgi:hypothetical protein
MMLLLLAMAAPACASCHASEAASYEKAPMWRSLFPAAQTDHLKNNPELRYANGDYRWEIRREGDRSLYSVTDGKSTIASPILWAFGFGMMGQTYMVNHDGVYYESTVSFYPRIKGLDFTPGHFDRPRRNLDEAFGRRLDPLELRRCFACHSTGGPQPEALGVQCDHCHTGAANHAAKMTPQSSLAGLTSEEESNICGKCHRTWEDVASTGEKGPLTVRFQPYRLTNSKCYDAEDRRIACTACHDPHGTTVRDVSFYDAKCMSCHASGKKCTVAAKDCVSCHMPKIQLPGIHYDFTDHWIRIAKPGDAYPG